MNKNEIEPCTEFAEDLPPVLADKTQIQQVFVNVFLNAIYAMPPGGKLVLRTA